MDRHYVYIYLDPFKPGRWEYETIVFDYKPFYVGVGTGYRYREHLTKSGIKKSKNQLKNRWINSILKNGVEPIINKLFVGLTLDEAKKIEIGIISHFGRIIDKSGLLTNITPGGDTTAANSMGAENIHSKIVYQYDLEGNFIKKWNGGCREIARTLNKFHSRISACCLGQTRKAYSSMWFYEYFGDKIVSYKRENSGDFSTKKVYVFDLESKLIKTFDSLSDASDYYGTHSSNLSSNILNKVKHKNLYFSYDENFTMPKQKFFTFKNENFRRLNDICLKFSLKLGQCKHKQKTGEINTVFV